MASQALDIANGGNLQQVLPPIAEPMSALADMTAPTLALPASTSYETWEATGRTLATQKRHLDWLIGDWINFGREHFPEQIELALTSISEEPRDLKRIERTARAFPPHLRDAGLSFDHHAHLADMPTQEALPLLKVAHAEHLTPSQLRIKAMIRKVEIGQVLPREDDKADDALMACIRAWNCAPRSVREEFAEMIADSDLGLIDP